MNKKIFAFVLFISSVITILITSLIEINLGFLTVVPKSKYLQKDDELVIQAKEVIAKNYYKPIDEEKLNKDLIKSMVDILKDPYTKYIPKEEMDKFQENLSGKYEGIGITVDDKSESLKIKDVIKNSEAHKKGILKGDIIKKINDIEVKNINELNQAFNKVEKIFNIVIFRPDSNGEMNFEVTKGEVSDVTVTSKNLGDIKYIKIEAFYKDTSKDVKMCLDEAMKSKAQGIVLDLRDNVGGDVAQATNIADYLLKSANIVKLINNDKVFKEYNSDKESIDIPLVVLVNEETKSSAEILAAALKDNQRAKIMGHRTFGKGVVQELVNLTDGSGIFITKYRYVTPSGNEINGVGIEPDIIIDPNSEDAITQCLKEIKLR